MEQGKKIESGLVYECLKKLIKNFTSKFKTMLQPFTPKEIEELKKENTKPKSIKDLSDREIHEANCRYLQTIEYNTRRTANILDWFKTVYIISVILIIGLSVAIYILETSTH